PLLAVLKRQGRDRDPRAAASRGCIRSTALAAPSAAGVATPPADAGHAAEDDRRITRSQLLADLQAGDLDPFLVPGEVQVRHVVGNLGYHLLALDRWNVRDGLLDDANLAGPLVPFRLGVEADEAFHGVQDRDHVFLTNLHHPADAGVRVGVGLAGV